MSHVSVFSTCFRTGKDFLSKETFESINSKEFWGINVKEQKDTIRIETFVVGDSS